MIKVDLHVHTVYSDDCLTPLHDVLRWARRRKLDALAVTDHHTLAGALALARMSPLPIIVGEEIRSTQGEIIGLFLNEEIPSDLSPRETVRRIRAQGGLVYVPHPFDRLRRSTLERQALDEIMGEVDALEVINGRVTFAVANQRAEALAQEYGLRCGAGSDAHHGFEIGRSYVEMPAFADAAGFLKGLSLGRVHGRVSSPLVHVGSTYARLAKGFLITGVSGR